MQPLHPFSVGARPGRERIPRRRVPGVFRSRIPSLQPERASMDQDAGTASAGPNDPGRGAALTDDESASILEDGVLRMSLDELHFSR